MWWDHTLVACFEAAPWSESTAWSTGCVVGIACGARGDASGVRRVGVLSWLPSWSEARGNASRVGARSLLASCFEALAEELAGVQACCLVARRLRAMLRADSDLAVS